MRKKKSLKRQLVEQKGLLEKRIAIMSGSTIGDIKDILEIFLLDFGIKPEFYIGKYGRFYEDVLYDSQHLHKFHPDLIYIHTSVRNLSDHMLVDKLQTVWTKIKEDFSCPIIQNNFEMPYATPEDGFSHINELNMWIDGYRDQNRDFYLNDIQHLAACYGLERWFDEQDYYLYKYAFSVSAIPLFCYNLAKVIKSIYGKSKKCLVLDLDNTLWGGAVGDVGVTGIELGMDTALGEAYVAFQKYVKSLHNRGIVLAVCSKNDESIAKAAFSNPNMILQLDDIAVFCANWESKAENLRKIAEQLNILPESMVFIDDNPAERELIRQVLPMVKVNDSNSVVDFIPYIEGTGYFYTTGVSDDDRKRNMYYAADKKRNEAKRTFPAYGEYLHSLRMSSEIRPFVSMYLERITQLINKTNQFNLTTKRYTMSEIQKITEDSRYITLYATLDDKFGSNGIVSVLIGETVEAALHIRLWVMSCRVFRRDLELAIFDYLVEACIKKELKTLVGYYFKTEKNDYVSGLFGDLGFSKVDDGIWTFNLSAKYQKKNKYIKIQKG